MSIKVGLSGVLALGFLALGCGSEPRVLKGPGADQAPTGTAAAAPEEKIELKPILGERTTDIRDASKELSEANAEVASTKIVAKDPITLQGNAYVTSIGRTSMMNIQHALDLYYAEHEKYPATLEDFMNEIIKPNGIALPQLPYYQEYAYDAPNHRLLVLEYPDRKAQFQKQQDKRFGRD